MTSYYNEIDPYAAQWLRNLIAAGHIADGVVDTRSIEDVHPADLQDFTQCHFFAGVGVWSLALRRAGWSDDRPVWTGSCPCQPFSAAGQGAGFDDERHLWPAFHHLIRECKPASVLGEQVASKDADPWIDLVHTDMEALGYAFGAVPFPSAGVGAPHIRDRLYWVANATNQRLDGRRSGSARDGRDAAWQQPKRLCDAGGLADARHDHDASQKQASGVGQSQTDRSADQPGGCGVSPDGLDHAICDGRSARRDANGGDVRQQLDTTGELQYGRLADAESSGRGEERADAGRFIVGNPAQGWPAGFVDGSGDLRPGPTNGFWLDADWLGCRDGKWRPVMPGTFPLVNGAPARVGRLRAYGNAINAEAARIWIEAVMEAAC